jgi:poly(3-hydroxybutyrate) depolymerase
MKQTSVLLLATFLCAASLEAAAKPSRESVEFRGRARTYSLFAPPELGAGEKVPLLLTFHGSGRDGASLVEKWAGLAKKEHILVAGLDSEDRSQWAFYLDPPELVRALVESLSSKYPVDPARVYLFGHSAGAVYALRLGLMESRAFAAVAVHAGSFRDEADFGAIQKATRKIPIFIVVGDRDPYFPPTSVDATLAALRAAGIPAESFVARNHDHDYDVTSSATNRRIWEFLAPRRLESAGATTP